MDLVIKVEAKRADVTAGAVAQFLSGVAIMRESVTLALSNERTPFASRLAARPSLMVWFPEHLVAWCGYAWSALGYWPPMDPLVRAGLAEGLVEACDPADGPQVVSVKAGSIVGIIRERLDRAEKLVKALLATKSLAGRSDPPQFMKQAKDVLESDGGMGFLPRMLTPSNKDLAMGAMMFGAQQIERSFRDVGAASIEASLQPADGGPHDGGSATTVPRAGAPRP